MLLLVSIKELCFSKVELRKAGLLDLKSAMD